MLQPASRSGAPALSLRLRVLFPLLEASWHAASSGSHGPARNYRLVFVFGATRLASEVQGQIISRSAIAALHYTELRHRAFASVLPWLVFEAF